MTAANMPDSVPIRRAAQRRQRRRHVLAQQRQRRDRRARQQHDQAQARDDDAVRPDVVLAVGLRGRFHDGLTGSWRAKR